ncbi:MAG: hypothetical protein AAFR61_16220 [Bacteroidota bacterium]
MDKKKVWVLVKLLSKKERAHCLRWLEAELNGSQQYVQRLATYLLTQSSPPSRTEVWEHLYGTDTPYDDSRLRKLSGDLSSRLEEYIAIEAFRKEGLEKQLALIKALNHKKAAKLFGKAARKMDQQLAAIPVKGSSYYYQQLSLTVERQRAAQFLPGGQASDAQQTLEQLSELADGWWLSARMELAIYQASMQQKFGLSRPTHIEEMLDYFQVQHHFQHDPRLQILHQLYRLLKGEKTVDPEALLIQILRNKDQFITNDRRNFYVSLLNFYIRKLNQEPDAAIAQQIYSLINWAIEDELVLVSGQLPPAQYKNFVAICIRLKDYEKAQFYLETYRTLLPEALQEDAYYLNLAYLYFSQENFREVISLLSDRRFRQSMNEIDARAYLLQAHYELAALDKEWLTDQIENLIRFIRARKDVSSHHKTSYLNRMRLLRRIVWATTQKELDQVEQELNNTRPIDKPAWLKQKIKAKRANPGG